METLVALRLAVVVMLTEIFLLNFGTCQAMIVTKIADLFSILR